MHNKKHSEKTKRILSERTRTFYANTSLEWRAEVNEKRCKTMKRLEPNKGAFKKGHRSWLKGIKAPEYVRRNMKVFEKGNIPFNKGKKLEDLFGVDRAGEIKKKNAKAHKRENLKKETRQKHSDTQTKLWQDPKYFEKMSDIHREQWKKPDYVRMMIRAQRQKPNQAEIMLYSILQEILPNEYALNVKAEIMVLGGKIPDFVNINGQKKLIELYGDYWHRNDNPQDKINFFKQFGWDTLVIWEKELKDANRLKEKILAY